MCDDYLVDAADAAFDEWFRNEDGDCDASCCEDDNL